MIVMRLSDGLGNQLFQYAAGEQLRARTGASIRYLIDAFASSRARADRPLLLPQLVECQDRLLPPFGLRSRFCQLMVRQLTPPGPAVRHIPGICHLTRSPGYDPRFDAIDGNMLVSGYFQAYRCVAPQLSHVRAQVVERFGARIDSARQSLRNRFGDGRLVAVHMRLGDYRAIGDGNEAIVPLERIRAVIAEIEDMATLIVFTDSPEILPQLDLGRRVESYLGHDALDDFAAMAACDDFVIANSTFSWWASTLAMSPGKTVWAPRDWLRPAKPGSDPDNPIYLPEHRFY